MRKRWIVLLPAWLALGLSLPAQKLVDRGSFTIIQNGAPIGSEDFSINIENGGGMVTTRSTLNVPKETRMATVGLDTKLTLSGALASASYELTIQEGREKQGIQVQFSRDKATCTFDLGAKKETQDVVFPSNGAILDHNIFCHVELLLLRYDTKRSGSQGFSVFVPQLGKDGIGTVFVRYVGKDECQWSRKRSKADHFEVASPNLTLDVWRDDSGRLLKLNIPQTGVSVERAR